MGYTYHTLIPQVSWIIAEKGIGNTMNARNGGLCETLTSRHSRMIVFMSSQQLWLPALHFSMDRKGKHALSLSLLAEELSTVGDFSKRESIYFEYSPLKIWVAYAATLGWWYLGLSCNGRCVWVHGPAAAMVSIDVYDSCYHQVPCDAQGLACHLGRC